MALETSPELARVLTLPLNSFDGPAEHRAVGGVLWVQQLGRRPAQAGDSL
jgi:hypothetical protein